MRVCAPAVLGCTCTVCVCVHEVAPVSALTWQERVCVSVDMCAVTDTVVSSAYVCVHQVRVARVYAYACVAVSELCQERVCMHVGRACVSCGVPFVACMCVCVCAGEWCVYMCVRTHGRYSPPAQGTQDRTA